MSSGCTSTPGYIHRALSNGFGFGGTNASLAFASWND